MYNLINYCLKEAFTPEMKFNFKKRKYGKELLIDCEKLSDVKSFVKNKNPFYVSFHEIIFLTEGEGIFKLSNVRLGFCI